jgi:hypothetical protein
MSGNPRPLLTLAEAVGLLLWLGIGLAAMLVPSLWLGFVLAGVFLAARWGARLGRHDR